jgi:hypothetical protein
MKTTDNGDKLRKFIYEKFADDKLTNHDLVQIIILCWDLLGLKTIQQYRKMYNKTYRGVALYNKNIVEINKQKLIIDNE